MELLEPRVFESNRQQRMSHTVRGLIVMAGVLLFAVLFMAVPRIFAAGTLQVTVFAGPNLVVDSNVESPSTYAPSVATVGVRYCNTGDAPLTNVQAYIGDYNTVTPANSTPGLYPQRGPGIAESPTFLAQHPRLNYSPATYSFTHVGGSRGLRDATRFIGTLAVNECRFEYWHLTYPRRETTAAGINTGDAVWGETNDYFDDLWLTLDAWGTSNEGSSNYDAHRMVMRNEISAMANKIEPNGGVWFNTDENTIFPGTVISTNGVRYDPNVVNKGFDNDGDFDYDYNIWLQPIGDTGYDPSCFRLIRTSGVLTVSRSGGQPAMIIPFQDQLYFTDLPVDNNGFLGDVIYTFVALNGPCSTALSPYQEVASGADNEKFNGDYGTNIGTIASKAPTTKFDKTASATSVAAGGAINYNLFLTNTGTLPLGQPKYGVPVVLSDTIPAGSIYVANTAAATSNFGGTFIIRYSTDSAAQSWTTIQPPAANVRHIQWWLNEALPVASGIPLTQRYIQASFGVTANNPAPANPFIVNTGTAGFGESPPFATDTTVTLIQGTGTIGDLVWRDENGNFFQEASELGLSGIAVNLYWDRDADGVLDADEPLIRTVDTNASGGYSFTQLPAGRFIVKVESLDPQVPTGYRLTSDPTVAVNLAVGQNFTTADFAFGPTLRLNKTLVTPNPSYKGDTVTYNVAVTNLLPGNGTGTPSSCVYNYWATAAGPNNGTGPSRWLPTTTTPPAANAYGANGPDGQTGYSDYSSNLNSLSGIAFNVASKAPATIQSVEAVLSMHILGTLTNDDARITVNLGASSTVVDLIETELAPYVGSTPTLLTRTITRPGGGSWSWSDFTGTTPELLLQSVKDGGTDTGIQLHVDAFGFRITTSASCGDSSSTMVTVPLSDVFNANLLDFVSASITPDTVATGTNNPYPNTGTITWDNIGPLYAGQTKNITVSFLAKQPADLDADGEPDPNPLPNIANTSGGTFTDGGTSNSATSTATGTLNPSGRIGDTIWNDVVAGGNTPDADGADNIPGNADDERGIPNVTVELLDALNTVIATTTTDANGNYLFDNVRDGTYTVRVVTTSLPNGGAVTQSYDPDGTVNSQTPVTINLNNGSTAGDVVLTADFGYRWVAPILVGSVWNDWNNSATSTPNVGEEGLSGVTVYLRPQGSTCTVPPQATPPARCASTTTNTNGDYTFTGLTGGTTYTVIVDPTTLPTLGNGSWTQTYDGPTGGTVDHSVTVTLPAGASARADYSYRKTGTLTIGDTVYVDWDGDSVQDTGEEGIAGVDVRLYEDTNGNGTVDTGDLLLTTQATNATGGYQFTGLASGNYLVQLDPSDIAASYTQTQDRDTTKDGQTGVALTTTSVDNADFGFRPTGLGTIGDFVWNDADRDGVQDPTEVGLGNITVRVYQDQDGDGVRDPEDALVTTTSTSAGGAGNLPLGTYNVTGLPYGNYIVQVDTLDPQLPTDGNGLRYVVSSLAGPSIPVTLSSTTPTVTTADFGFTVGATLGDTVYQDSDRNGTQGPFEPAINGVQVTLYNDVNGNKVYDAGIDTAYYYDVNANGTYDAGTDTLGQVDTATINGDAGQYFFRGLPAGNYVVVVNKNDPQLPSNVLTGDPTEVDVCVTCDGQYGTDLRAGQIYLGVDFGFQAPGRIGDTLWIDADNDGQRDWIDYNGNNVHDVGEDTETGLAGVTVELRNSSNVVIATTTTDSDGYYLFANVPNGNYTTVVLPATLPAGLTQTYDPDGGLLSNSGTMNNQAPATVTGGGDVLTHDYGYRYLGTFNITGTTFFDVANNGGTYINGTDAPFQSVPVYLWRRATPSSPYVLIAETQTTSGGLYSFTGLPNGDYVTSVNRELNPFETLSPTAPTPIAPVTNPIRTITINNANVTQQDFGFYGSNLLDFGDLPSAYSTLLSENGPSHVVGSLSLGSSPSVEDNGQESATATGDTDDGVSMPGPVVSGPKTLTVISSGAGFLSGWVDWNLDGDFDDANENILANQAVVAGSQPVGITVPSGVSSSSEYPTRFRLFATSVSNPATAYRGGAVNGEVEDYMMGSAPLSATMASFEAQAEATSIQVLWETANELNNVGFNIFRATSPDATPTKVNAALIASQSPGNSGGFSYQWTDYEVAAGETYYYWIEDVDTNGVATRHGPVSASVSTPTAITLGGLATSEAPAWPAAALSLMAGLTALAFVARRRSA